MGRNGPTKGLSTKTKAKWALTKRKEEKPFSERVRRSHTVERKAPTDTLTHTSDKTGKSTVRHPPAWHQQENPSPL